MRRPTIVLAILLFSGCGEPERPRFVPATGANTTASDRQADKASGEVVVPKNIPMH
jgi:hypothetical protein